MPAGAVGVAFGAEYRKEESLFVQDALGASGALFGLAGAWKAWDWREARRSGTALWPILLWLLGLAVLNLVLWVLQGGLLAWETHLGGFMAGWIWVMVQSDRAGSR